MENIILNGPEVRRAFNDFLLALSAGLTPLDSGFARGNGFYHLNGDNAHDRRVNMLYFLSTLMESVLKDSPKPIIDWLKTLMLKLFVLAAARGASVPSAYGETLEGVMSHLALVHPGAVNTLDARFMSVYLSAPDERTPAELNDADLDDDSSALAARVHGDPVAPARHVLESDPDGPAHRLPAANAMRLRRERGYPVRAVSATYFDDGGEHVLLYQCSY